MLLTSRTGEFIINSVPSYWEGYIKVGSKLLIEGEEYSAQSRTLKFIDRRDNERYTRYISFPRLYFSKYTLEGDYYFYSVVGQGEKGLVHINLRDINATMGMVGLGEMAGGDYTTRLNLELSEFVESFWLSSFFINGIENLVENVCDNNKLKLVLPHLWAKA